jgi:hypothetical protein
MIRNIRDSNNIQLKKPLKNIVIYGEDENILLLQKVESYILNEGNIMDISWNKWEAPTYNYKYTINNKNAGRLFKTRNKDFELFMSSQSQEVLESIYNGGEVLFKSPDTKFFTDTLVGSELVTIHQVLPDNVEEGFKTTEDIYNKLKIKLNVQMDENTMELYIAKNIATMFQRLRKYGGFHVYDNLRLFIGENKFKNIIEKHMDYIMKTTRVKVEIITEKLTTFDYNKIVEINEEDCDMYLVRC